VSGSYVSESIAKYWIRAYNTAVIEFHRRICYTSDGVLGLGKRLEHDDKA